MDAAILVILYFYYLITMASSLGMKSLPLSFESLVKPKQEVQSRPRRDMFKERKTQNDLYNIRGLIATFFFLPLNRFISCQAFHHTLHRE